jgi:hypothetical protein
MALIILSSNKSNLKDADIYVKKLMAYYVGVIPYRLWKRLGGQFISALNTSIRAQVYQ